MTKGAAPALPITNVINDAALRAVHWKVIIVAAVGLVFDGFDFQATAYAAPLIRNEWHLDPKVLGGLISAGFFGLFFGSVVASYLADLFGRKTAFVLCTLLYSIFTAAAAFAPDFEWFIAMRFLTGIGLGGVVPIAAAWVMEFMPARRRAFIASAVISCFLLGWIFASAAALFVIPTYGWRAFFFIGALPALLAVFLIFWGAESPMWLLSRGQIDKAYAILRQISPDTKWADYYVPNNAQQKSNWLNLFSLNWLRPSIIIGLFFFLIATVSAGITQWLPTLLVNRGITLENTYLYSLVVSIGPMVGSIVMGALLDVIGRRLSFVLFWCGASLSIVLFAFATSPAGVMLLGFSLTFFAIATYTCLDVLTGEMYPTELRASAIGWGLGMSRLGGAFGPILGGYLVNGGISYAGFFLVFAVPPMLNVLLSAGLGFSHGRPQLLE
jgi:benzoate transport